MHPASLVPPRKAGGLRPLNTAFCHHCLCLILLHVGPENPGEAQETSLLVEFSNISVSLNL